MPKQIFPEQVGELVEKGAQLVDVLSGEEFEAVQIAGSVNLPIKRASWIGDHLARRRSAPRTAV